MTRSSRMFAGLAVLALLGAACSSSSNKKATTAKTATTAARETGTTMKEEMMPLPDYTKAYKVSVSSPADGVRVTENTLTLQVAAAGYQPSCVTAGKPNQPGQGHYHLLIDKSLINMFCTTQATISMQNVKPGPHTIEAVPTINDHAEVMDGARELKIDYEPTNPLPEITDVTEAAKASIKILSPKPGDTVSGPFDVVVSIQNFHNSCDLFGKPAVAGYGHWHVNLDADAGPMMGMGTMLGMSCETVFHATTEGLKSGETHTVIALLVDNGHAPFHPNIKDAVPIRIG